MIDYVSDWPVGEPIDYSRGASAEVPCDEIVDEVREAAATYTRGASAEVSVIPEQVAQLMMLVAGYT